MRKFSKLIAGLILAVIAVLGVSACDSSVNDYSGSVYSAPGPGLIPETEYGAYNSYGTFVYWSSPRVVYVSHSYYISHSRTFANPRHHVYVPPRSSYGSGSTRHTSGTTTVKTRTTVRTSGSRKR